MSILHYGYTFRRYFVAAMIYVIATISCALIPTSQSYAQFDEDYIKSFLSGTEEQDLILRIMRGKKRIISADYLALEKDLQVYFPLSPLAEELGLNITVDFEEGRAEGWLLKQDNPYWLDTKTKSIFVNGKTSVITEDEYLIQNLGSGVGDIYLTIEALNKLWPLDFEFSYDTLLLIVNTKELLPVESSRLLRGRHADFLTLKQDRESKDRAYQELLASMPEIENGYKLISLPRINISNSFSWDQNERFADNDFLISGRSDFLGTDADFNLTLSYNNEDKSKRIENARLRFKREAYYDGDLPFGLQSLSFGDGGLSAAYPIGESVSGRGISISNAARVFKAEFDAINVTGLAEPGWSIELFVNNTLEEVDVVPNNGEYRFENVQLNFGVNEIKVVLYGPLGEIEERIEKHIVAGSVVPKGKTYFQADIVDVSKTLIPLQSENLDPNAGKKAIKIQAQRGINRVIGATASFTDIPTDTEDKQFVTAGLNFSAFEGNGKIELYKELGGGVALDTKFARNLFGLNVNLQNTWLYDLQTSSTGTDPDKLLKLRSEARIGRRLNTDFGTLNLNFSATHQERTNNARSTSLSLSKGLSMDKASFSNNIRASVSNDKLSAVSGSFSGRTQLGKTTSVSGSAFYTVQPHFDFTTFQARASNKSGPEGKILSSMSLTQSLLSKSTTLGLNFGYEFKKFIAGINFNWNRGSGTDVGLRLSTSLGPFGEDGAYMARGKSLISDSKLNARVFLDKDGDTIFGPEDRLLPNTYLKIGNRPSPKSDENGEISLLGRTTNRLVGITVDENRLPDAFYKASTPGYKTILRPGTTVNLDFPVIETGTIDGFASFEDGRTLPGITLQLLNEEGVILDEVRTMFDGFFQFDYIFPGTYVIQASPKYEQIFTAPQTVVVASDDPFVFDLEITLQRRLEDKPAEKAEIDGQQNGRIAQTSTMNAAAAESVKNAASQPTTDGNAPLAAPVTSVDEMPLADDSTTGQTALTSSETYMTEPDMAVMYNPVVIINHIRLGQHPDKLRLVVDLSGTVAYRLNPSETGDAIVIDLPNASPNVALTLPDSSDTILNKITLRDLEDGSVSQLVLEANERIKLLDEGLIPSRSGDGMRLYIDLALED